MIGRSLVRKGECLFHGRADAGLTLRPASAWTVTGDADPTSWQYLVHLAGPSRQLTLNVVGADVLHFMYASDPSRPWRGIGPLEAASLAGRLSAELAAASKRRSSRNAWRVAPGPERRR